MPDSSLDIVTRGWELPGWVGGFYPEDLPQEWRLTYFANEFPAVMVPPQLWVGASESALCVRADDVTERFRFYLELPVSRPPSGSVEIARRCLGHKLAGLVAAWGTAMPPGADAVDRYRLVDDLEVTDAEGVAVAYSIPASESADPRAGRARLEALARRLQGGHGLVLLDGPDLSADTVRDWWYLASLLGLA